MYLNDEYTQDVYAGVLYELIFAHGRQNRECRVVFHDNTRRSHLTHLANGYSPIIAIQRVIGVHHGPPLSCFVPDNIQTEVEVEIRERNNLSERNSVEMEKVLLVTLYLYSEYEN